MITRLRIRGFRSIEDLEIRPSRLCALIGENNAGKTNILRAIRATLGKDWLSVRDFGDEDFLRHNVTTDIVIEVEFDPAPEYRGFAMEDPTPVPMLRYTLTRYKKDTKDARKGDLRLLQECLKRDGGPISVLREAPKKGEQRKYKPLTAIPSGIKEQVPVIYIGPDRRLADQLPSTRYSLLRRLLEQVADSLKGKMVTDADGGQIGLLEHFETRLSEALSVLQVDEFIALEALLRDHALVNLGFDPRTERDRFALRFDIHEAVDFFKSMRLVVEEHGIRVDALDLGDGAQNAIIIAIFQAYERMKKAGAIFLVEEPELHLHPHKCRHFYATLRRIADSNQVIYTTHSPYFVNVPFFDEIRRVARDPQGKTHVVEPSLVVTSVVREKLVKELDPERNELFFSRHVILVEGDTEKLALPIYARRLSLDLDRAGVSLVEVGGKRSLDLFTRIVSSLGLAQTVVFDEDSSDFSRKEKDTELAYNEALLAKANATTNVLMMKKDYEAELRREWGNEKYEAACRDRPDMSKALRARLFALDEGLPVPTFVRSILEGACSVPTGA